MRKRHQKIFSYVGVALLVVIFTLALTDRAGGPTAETFGVIQSTGFVLADTPPRHVASIKLATGEVVQANINPGVSVRPGNTVRVKVYRRIISGTKTYGVVSAEPAK